MKNLSPAILTAFLAINQIKWECRNNVVSRRITDEKFTIAVTNNKEEKSFEVIIQLTEAPSKIIVRTLDGAVEVDYREFTNALKWLYDSKYISQTVHRKYSESFLLVGEPIDIRADLHSETTKTKSERIKTYLAFRDEATIDTTLKVTKWSYLAKGLTGNIWYDVILLQTGEDNALSGSYYLIDNLSQSLQRLVVNENGLTVEHKDWLTEVTEPETSVESPEEDFKAVIGNKSVDLDTSNPLPGDDRKVYIYPDLHPITTEDLVNVILAECNERHRLYTVASALDFDKDAARIAIGSVHGHWLNLIVAIKDGIAYLSHGRDLSSRNYTQSLNLSNMETMATLTATFNNINLIRELVSGLIMRSPATYATGQVKVPDYTLTGTGQNSWFVEKAVEPTRRRDAEPFQGAIAIPAEQFTALVYQAFHGYRTTVGGRQGKWDRLSELLYSLRLERLTQGDVNTIEATGEIAFITNHINPLSVYQVIRRIRPSFNVHGSLSNQDF